MANKARGFVDVELGEETLSLCLTLDALAEIEDALGVEAFEDALNFSGKVSAKKLRLYLPAILKGNDIEITEERRIALKKIDAQRLMEIIHALAAGGGMENKEGGASPPLPESPSEGATDGSNG